MLGCGLALACLLLVSLSPELAEAQSRPRPEPVALLPTTAPQPPGGPDVEVVPPLVPIPAKARSTVFLDIVNLGPGDIRDVFVTIRPTLGTQAVIVGRFDHELETIEEDEGSLIGLRIAAGDLEGAATFDVQMRYTAEDDVTRERTQSFNIQVGAARSDPLVIEYTGGALIPGEEQPLTLRVHNPTNALVRNLDVELQPLPGSAGGIASLTDGALATAGQAPLNAASGGSLIARGAGIDPGESVDAETRVITSRAADDVLRFRVSARYSTDGFERTQTFEFGVPVEPSFRLKLLEAREERVGDRFELTGTLVNLGTATAFNPLVRVPEGSAYEATRAHLVSDLEPNNPVAFRMATKPMNDTAVRGPLVEVVWNDERGREHVRVVEGLAQEGGPPQESVWQPQRLLTWPWMLLWIVPLAALGGRALWQARKRRAEDAA